MRFFWFFLTLLTLTTWQLPAWAGKLVSWDFNDQRRQLQFRTDERVQPQAQLISDPSRLVIDLPGTVLGRSSVSREYRGKIKSIRLGQFSPNMMRLVIELLPGYTLDPNGIKFEGRSPTNWLVDLPEPQLIDATNTTTQIPTSETLPSTTETTTEGTTSSGTNAFLGNRLQVTQGGLFIDLNQTTIAENITTEQNGDRLDITLKNVQLPSELANQTVTLNRYKIQQIQFRQRPRNEAQISLKLAPNSPKWRALPSSQSGGGLVLLPSGGTSNLESPAASTVKVPEQFVEPRLELTTVESFEFTNNGTNLLLSGNGRLLANGAWNRNTGVYQIRIDNATLAQPVRGPKLNSSSPVVRVSMRQDNESTVVIEVEPALGVQIGDLSQTGDRLLSLELKRAQNQSSVFIPPQNGTSTQTDTSIPSFDPPQSNVLVMIDPGHGGKDPGAVGIGGLQEKNVILPISQEVAQILQQNGVTARLTRDTDYFVSLEGRAQMANNAGADIFVSIHANAISMSRPEVNGLEVYYHKKGRELAATIHRTILNRISMRDRGVRTARFYVLRNTNMPSVLVEVGFVTGREDAPNLSSSAHRSKMAQAIAEGILEYIQTNQL